MTKRRDTAVTMYHQPNSTKQMRALPLMVLYSIVVMSLSLIVYYDPPKVLLVQAKYWDGVDRIQFPSPFSLRGGTRTTSRTQNARKTGKGTKKYCRTTFKWKSTIPTDQDVSDLIHINDNIRINHDFVGITNPCLNCENQVYNTIENTISSETKSSNQQTSDNVAAAAKSTSTMESNHQKDPSTKWWIPDGIRAYNIKNPQTNEISSSLSSSYNNKYNNNRNNIVPNHTKNQSQQPLRVLRYRRKVGNGDKCYSKLRDVALQWERMHEGSSWAGIRILKPNNYTRRRTMNNYNHYRDNDNDYNNDYDDADTMRRQVEEVKEDLCAPLPENVSENVMQIWSEPGGRKLVTMSRIGGGKWPIWVINPCVVVYDLVDCRGKDMTYSSTAYATLRGHLLAGEERVTVAIHDGGQRSSGSNTNLNEIFFTNSLPSQTNIDGGGDVYVEILSCSRPAPSLLGRAIFPFVKGMQDRFFKEQIDTLERIATSDSMR